MKKFENFRKNLAVLRVADSQDLSNSFIVSGIIEKFLLQFELSWKVLKEVLEYEGVDTSKTGSPREIIKAAYKIYDWLDEELWLSMLSERTLAAHIYDEEIALKLVDKILHYYLPAFLKMEDTFLKYNLS